MVRLFGFKLENASAVLLFVFAVGLLLIGFYEIYIIWSYMNETGQIPIVHLIFMILVFTLGIYILFQTLRHRAGTIKG